MWCRCDKWWVDWCWWLMSVVWSKEHYFKNDKTNVSKFQAWLIGQIISINEVELHWAIMTPNGQMCIAASEVPAETYYGSKTFSLDQTFTRECRPVKNNKLPSNTFETARPDSIFFLLFQHLLLVGDDSNRSISCSIKWKYISRVIGWTHGKTGRSRRYCNNSY